ncbi:hypothetical protein CDEST_09608 [Colletotrichum destructivum]|uniref:Uncharacterized protein n=1 Tax=Colletotrichum destructivum TaxID=34406 RepID=A0AAX4IP16_9PEZI|nr:hypothetical protein CDEST_09608 [Colletotrichum destructivum]
MLERPITQDGPAHDDYDPFLLEEMVPDRRGGTTGDECDWTDKVENKCRIAARPCHEAIANSYYHRQQRSAVADWRYTVRSACAVIFDATRLVIQLDVPGEPTSEYPDLAGESSSSGFGI